MSEPRVEILYFDGCPNHEAAREAVERVAAEIGVDPEIELVEVLGEDQVGELRFLGSPTVRVNDRDVEAGADERRDYVLACRVYRSEEGVQGRPLDAWIRRALAEAER
jgi:hypothetical protein